MVPINNYTNTSSIPHKHWSKVYHSIANYFSSIQVIWIFSQNLQATVPSSSLKNFIFHTFIVLYGWLKSNRNSNFPSDLWVFPNKSLLLKWFLPVRIVISNFQVLNLEYRSVSYQYSVSSLFLPVSNDDSFLVIFLTTLLFFFLSLFSELALNPFLKNDE
mgnify:CR=1 FL=1